MSVQRYFSIGLLCVSAMLAGCTMTGKTAAAPAVQRADPSKSFSVADGSIIIDQLLARKSVVPSGTTYDQVSIAVLAKSARASEAELQAAKLRAQAASKNWLPSIGPSVSLTSLSSIVAGIVVEQVLFDNGRKKAERAFSAADVEAAAVTLSTDKNERVLTALSLYLEAERARDEARISRTSRNMMTRFSGIMEERVEGGVSNMTELRVIRTKVKEIAAQAITDASRADTAMAELNEMSGTSLSGVKGLGTFLTAPNGVTPLTVLKAQAQRDREIAEASMARAGMLPGISAGGTIGDGGSMGISLKSETLVGFGTGAELKAVEATKEAAVRRVSLAIEDANRHLRRLSQQLATLQAKANAAIGLAKDAHNNHRVFQEQFEAGARSIMDVIGIYETAMRLEREAAGIKYEQMLVRLRIAAAFGALVDGADI